MKLLRLGVLISGSGRSLQNFIDRIGDGRLDAMRIEHVVSSRPDVKGVERARQARMPVTVVDPKSTGFHDVIAGAFDLVQPDLVLMAGFVHLWLFPERYDWRVMNIHPGLFPRYGGEGMYGDRVHAAVLCNRERESGCTVHFADRQYDHGPVILERRVPVRVDDTVQTLAARVFEAECEAYPEAVRLYQQGRIHLEGGRVVVR